MATTVPKIRLSDTQRRVVEFGDGPLLVVAGPGTGKTRVLTERVRRLLSIQKEHFRVLALTFTNKAAREMEERLDDLGELGTRTFIGTLHGFCLDMLSDRGKPVGVNSTPQIFEQFSDRRQVLAEAVAADPLLNHELMMAGDAKARTRKLDDWLRAISNVKNHPMTIPEITEPQEQRIFDAYNAGLEASGAFDFDDLLLLAYRLLIENEKIAAFLSAALSLRLHRRGARPQRSTIRRHQGAMRRGIQQRHDGWRPEPIHLWLHHIKPEIHERLPARIRRNEDRIGREL